MSYADFYALMPSDNATTVEVGEDVSFPHDGNNNGNDITRASDHSFTLGPAGVYQVLFHVSITEPGQLVLTLNGSELPYTVVGRSAENTQIVGMSIVTTRRENSVLTVRNPSANASALTVTCNAGGCAPVSAHLVIVQLHAAVCCHE